VEYIQFQDNGNFITFNPSPTAHWNMPFNGDGCFAGIADNEEDFYLTIQRGVMYKMKLDTNAERLAFNRMDPISADSTNYMFINPMVMDENADIIYWAEGHKFWRNNDVTNSENFSIIISTNCTIDAITGMFVSVRIVM